jgi:hypothetical protein
LLTTVNPNSELISFDVVSLYTNIPHDLGISAITYWLENKRNIVQDRFSKEFILETVKIILERNVFYFDGKFYRQKGGTAMGTKMAPTYATLVLGYLEHILYEQLLNSYGQKFASYVRQNWKRFLDDCFIIWNSDIPVEIFHTELNSLNDHIRFTINRSKIEMPNMFKVSKNKSSVSWRHFSSHCGSSFLSVKLTVKIENISFKNNFHGFKNKIFRKAILYNVSFIFQPYRATSAIFVRRQFSSKKLAAYEH